MGGGRAGNNGANVTRSATQRSAAFPFDALKPEEQGKRHGPARPSSGDGPNRAGGQRQHRNEVGGPSFQAVVMWKVPRCDLRFYLRGAVKYNVAANIADAST